MILHVVGAGWVGLVTAAVFASQGHLVHVLDTNIDRLHDIAQGRLPFFEEGLSALVSRGMQDGRLFFSVSHDKLPFPDAVFCCVGTPQGEDGRADLSAVYASAEWHHAHFPSSLFVVKSTVPPQTGDALALRFPRLFFASNPEFLAEGTAVHDAMHPARLVFGAENEEAHEVLHKVYASWIARGVAVVHTDRVTAELAKYAANAFLATKISFVNELHEFAEGVGADMDMVTKSMGYDPRIGNRFLAHGLGYGGSCFPKDVQALLACAHEARVELPLLREVHARNERQRERYIEKILTAYHATESVGHVAILGMAYKSGTDDIRSSPAVYVLQQLLARGVPVLWFDPCVTQVDDSVRGESCAAVCADASVIFIATDWPEIMTYARENLSSDRVIWGRPRGTL